MIECSSAVPISIAAYGGALARSLESEITWTSAEHSNSVLMGCVESPGQAQARQISKAKSPTTRRSAHSAKALRSLPSPERYRSHVAHDIRGSSAVSRIIERASFNRKMPRGMPSHRGEFTNRRALERSDIATIDAWVKRTKRGQARNCRGPCPHAGWHIKRTLCYHSGVFGDQNAQDDYEYIYVPQISRKTNGYRPPRCCPATAAWFITRTVSVINDPK